MLKLIQTNISNHKGIQSITTLCNKLFCTNSNPTSDVQTVEVETIDKATERFKKHNLLGSSMVSENVLHSMVGNKLFRELPILHVIGCKNNTKAQLTDYNKRPLCFCSCGTVGFKNAKKSTSVAGHVLGLTIGFKAKKLGITHVRSVLYGLTPNRMSCLTGLAQTGIKIVSLTDNTPIHHGLGRRPHKVPRK